MALTAACSTDATSGSAGMRHTLVAAAAAPWIRVHTHPWHDRGMAVDRDRDEEGRAHNARPRDGLGRPLPYGSEGVERQPEGIERTPDETVREAQQLLDDGKPFHAHEVFEDAWKTGPDDEADL